MPVYEYSALDLKGKKTSGIMDAESSLAARQKLRDANIFPVSIKETEDTSARGRTEAMSLFGFFTRVQTSEVSMMTGQLATLVGAGFPLVTAIDTLIPQTKSHAFKKILSQIKDAIVEGNSFAGALSPYPKVFSSVYVNMVRAGETSGTLEVVLDRLADISEKRQAFTNRIRAALAYPVFILLFAMVVLFLLLTYIVPTVTMIFADMNQVLPAPTRFLIAFSDLLKSYWWVIILLGVGMLLAFQGFKKTAKGRYLMDKTLLHLPGIGVLVVKSAVARVSRTLGSLLENGVFMLGKVADVFENEVESTVVSLVSILGPVMILIMGVVAGFIVLSICLPIFEMNRLVL